MHEHAIWVSRTRVAGEILVELSEFICKGCDDRHFRWFLGTHFGVTTSIAHISSTVDKPFHSGFTMNRAMILARVSDVKFSVICEGIMAVKDPLGCCSKWMKWIIFTVIRCWVTNTYFPQPRIFRRFKVTFFSCQPIDFGISKFPTCFHPSQHMVVWSILHHEYDYMLNRVGLLSVLGLIVAQRDLH